MRYTVNQSPWPIILSINLGSWLLNFISHNYILATMTPALVSILLWSIDFFYENRSGVVNDLIRKTIAVSFIFFLLMEFMYFVALFWCIASNILIPTLTTWPTESLGVTSSNIPILATALLLGSSVSATASHHYLEAKIGYKYLIMRVVTILMGFTFLLVTFLEFYVNPVKIVDGIYGSIFYMLIGTHLIHVVIGLLVLVLAPKGRAFIYALYYWHFVDLIWIVVASLAYCPFLILVAIGSKPKPHGSGYTYSYMDSKHNIVQAPYSKLPQFLKDRIPALTQRGYMEVLPPLSDSELTSFMWFRILNDRVFTKLRRKDELDRKAKMGGQFILDPELDKAENRDSILSGPRSDWDFNLDTVHPTHTNKDPIQCLIDDGAFDWIEDHEDRRQAIICFLIMCRITSYPNPSEELRKHFLDIVTVEIEKVKDQELKTVMTNYVRGILTQVLYYRSNPIFRRNLWILLFDILNLKTLIFPLRFHSGDQNIVSMLTYLNCTEEFIKDYMYFMRHSTNWDSPMLRPSLPTLEATKVWVYTGYDLIPNTAYQKLYKWPTGLSILKLIVPECKPLDQRPRDVEMGYRLMINMSYHVVIRIGRYPKWRTIYNALFNVRTPSIYIDHIVRRSRWVGKDCRVKLTGELVPLRKPHMARPLYFRVPSCIIIYMTSHGLAIPLYFKNAWSANRIPEDRIVMKFPASKVYPQKDALFKHMKEIWEYYDNDNVGYGDNDKLTGDTTVEEDGDMISEDGYLHDTGVVTRRDELSKFMEYYIGSDIWKKVK